jgi:hypothetical protein
MAGKLGGLACVARYGKAQMARQLKANHDAHYLTLVDPNGALDPRDRAQRAKAASDAQLAGARMQQIIARHYGRSSAQITADIEHIARPVSACVYCYLESGEPFPEATHHTCRRHAKRNSAA